ncbi:hypothetical protein DE4576_04837 [Mycobacterium marinum]|uniref:hypothetical protein n=1 Tax=Mycobacterium marinum TaxID=1781 RepID=UPI000E3BBE7C|nr:hypothetical protein [Mycobacterium marinum]RFZ63196.1 hypothetical protein DE4576_04837 [Mycobacterium marinum]
MSTELVVHEPGLAETRQERAHRRTKQLHNAFQTVFEVLAEIYSDEDWRHINDSAGRPYTGFTTFVQDQLGCAASNARRYQQGIVGLVLPLQELTSPGTRIPVTSSHVARLGVTGARVVVAQAPNALDGLTDPESQAEALRDLIDTVAQRSTAPGLGPLQVTSTTSTPTPAGALVPAEIPEGDVDIAAPPTTDNNGNEHEPALSPPPWQRPDTAYDPRTPPGNASHTQMTDPTNDPASATVPESPPSYDAMSLPQVVQMMRNLEAAITAVLAVGDPTTIAQHLTSGQATALAPKCLAAGQRLVCLGQIARSVS